jgi:hypothetical protein
MRTHPGGSYGGMTRPFPGKPGYRSGDVGGKGQPAGTREPAPCDQGNRHPVRMGWPRRRSCAAHNAKVQPAGEARCRRRRGARLTLAVCLCARRARGGAARRYAAMVCRRSSRHQTRIVLHRVGARTRRLRTVAERFEVHCPLDVIAGVRPLRIVPEAFGNDAVMFGCVRSSRARRMRTRLQTAPETIRKPAHPTNRRGRVPTAIAACCRSICRGSMS